MRAAAEGGSAVLLACDPSVEGVLSSIGLAYLAHLPADRVRLARDDACQARLDEVVIGIERTALPHELVPDPEAVGASLYDYLRTTGFGIVRATQHIGAASVTAELAGLVDQPPGAAMLHLTRIGYLDNGVAVELTHSWFRSDYFTLVAELKM